MPCRKFHHSYFSKSLIFVDHFIMVCVPLIQRKRGDCRIHYAVTLDMTWKLLFNKSNCPALMPILHDMAKSKLHATCTHVQNKLNFNFPFPHLISLDKRWHHALSRFNYSFLYWNNILTNLEISNISKTLLDTGKFFSFSSPFSNPWTFDLSSCLTNYSTSLVCFFVTKIFTRSSWLALSSHKTHVYFWV